MDPVGGSELGARSSTLRSCSGRPPGESEITGRDPRLLRATLSGSFALPRDPSRPSAVLHAAASACRSSPQLARLLGLPHRARPSSPFLPASTVSSAADPLGSFGPPQVCCTLQTAMGFTRFRAPATTPRKSSSQESLPAGAHPPKRSPPRWRHDRHRRPCSREIGRSPIGFEIHRRVRSAVRDVSVRRQSMLPWAFGMRFRCRTCWRVPVGSHRADHIPFTSKSASENVPSSVRARRRNRGPRCTSRATRNSRIRALHARSGMPVADERASTNGARLRSVLPDDRVDTAIVGGGNRRARWER
jgi:hypothetical protein